MSNSDGAPIAGATVVAFTDFAKRQGAQATTAKNGVASLALGASSKKVERLYVYAESGFWNSLANNVTLSSSTKIKMQPIDLSFTDCLRFFYGNAAATGGKSVTVGVIDTGIGPHRDLTVAGGENTVVGEAQRTSATTAKDTAHTSAESSPHTGHRRRGSAAWRPR